MYTFIYQTNSLTNNMLIAQKDWFHDCPTVYWKIFTLKSLSFKNVNYSKAFLDFMKKNKYRFSLSGRSVTTASSSAKTRLKEKLAEMMVVKDLKLLTSVQVSCFSWDKVQRLKLFPFE